MLCSCYEYRRYQKAPFKRRGCSFDNYIRILRHLWGVIEQNPLYKTIITKQMLCTGWDGKTVDRVLEAMGE